MTYLLLNRPRTGKNQRGFAMIQIMVALLIMTYLAILGGSKYVTIVNDAAAESTGRYLTTVRAAVIKLLSTYDATLTLVDTGAAPPGTYPTPPPWLNFSGNDKRFGITDLKESGLLPDSFPDLPPLGRSVHVQLLRSGACPGDTCKIAAYVFTCWPINAIQDRFAINNRVCTAPQAGSDFDSNLVGSVIAATDGYGGSNYLLPATMRGALFNIPMTTLGLPANSPGHVAVLASLDDSMFSQFVRQGDTRHIFLQDSLTVTKQVSAGEGLLLPTDSVVGQICPTPWAYGTSTKGSYVQCMGGRWLELVNHTLLSSRTVSDGYMITNPVCGGAMLPFSYVSLQSMDVTMSGADIAITGALSGGITGSGNVNSAGSVSVSGTFNGTTTSGAGSSIRVAQKVEMSGSRVTITPPTANARALLMQGCKYL